ncbi:hypothetical protein KR222_005352, partial [Zaprionus bogoriensis]
SYNEITYFPKNYLNVLTGPNGTGKSTLVSAIILGLGGEPQLLDRSSNIADYIKSGRSSAAIIVTIYGKSRDTEEAFKRTINGNGESRFSVNSKDVGKSKYLNTIASYNIQVGNLCQFLPQDRVQDFSKMNPQELLANTMSSVCDNQFIKTFKELKELRASKLSTHVDREQQKENLKKEEHRLEQLRATVEQFQERQEMLKKINIYQVKKLWLEVSAGKEKLDGYKSQRDKAAKDCNTVRKTYEKQKSAQEKIVQKNAELRDKTLEQAQLINQNLATKRDLWSQLENVKHKIHTSKCELERDIQNASKSKSEVGNLMNIVEAKQQELKEFNENKAEVLRELEQQKRAIQKTREAAMSQYKKRMELETMLNDEKIPEITALSHKIERLQNIKTQKIEVMRHENPNLVKAMSWVAENKHNFKSNIYDPMIFELNIASEEAAMYLENVVRQRDLCAFICEDKGDMSELINELCVKQKLGVNILYCPPADSCSYTSTVPIAELMPMGFKAYLVDLVTGPMPIINKLCGTYQIHNIPFGKDEVSNFTSSIPKSIRLYFGGTKKFLVTTSRYRPDLILTESAIRRKNQLISLDTKALSSLKERHAKAISEKDRLRNNLQEVDNKFERLEKVMREEKDNKKKVDQKVAYFENLEKEVKKLLERVDDLNKSYLSLETIQNTFKKSLQSNLRKIYSIESNLANTLETLNELQKLRKINQAMENVHKQEHETQLNLLKECEEQYKKATEIVEKLQRSLQNQEQEIETKTNDIRRLCNGQLPTQRDFTFREEFNEISTLDLEKVREALMDFQARLECMRNVDSESVNDYRQRQAQVEELKKNIEQKRNQEQNVDAQIESLYNEWVPKLNDLVETISTKFSEFMESISYIGEVVLSQKEKNDFDSYGIQIMVQYRKDAKLQNLDKYIQSGGERAVAIAIYSLSLQHVTNVPFRCVDEINQGMDATNERHIFELLLREATKPGSAQYLFVTPKLPRGLNYNKHLCVTVVHNSASIKSDAKFSLC